jgi:hypothetical protein
VFETTPFAKFFALTNTKTIGSILALALVIGGLTFYAAIVVPAASSVWGATDQGFVTRLVTWRLNLIATPFFIWIAVVHWQSPRKLVRYSALGLLLVQVGLWLAHRSLDQLLETNLHIVLDESQFYRHHQIYLWLTTAEIFLGWVLLLNLCQLLASEKTVESSVG